MPWKSVHPIVDGMKICMKCGQNKSISDFPVNKIIKAGYDATCDACRKIQDQDYYQRNKELIKAKARAYNKTEHRVLYQRKYQRERDRYLGEQFAGTVRAAICDICGQPEPRGITVCDHDHETGKFRGWLCNRCNRTLGFVEDDIALLQKLIMYLEFHDDALPIQSANAGSLRWLSRPRNEKESRYMGTRDS